MVLTVKCIYRAKGLRVSLLLLSCLLLGVATVTAAETWDYVALGDSLAFGILDLSGGGYVPRYGGYLQLDNGVTIRLNNLGRNGWTSAQLLAALKTDSVMRSAITSAKVVTWDIGGNDFLRARTKYQSTSTYNACGGADNQDCFRSTVAEFKRNWDGIMSEILSLRSTGNTIIRTMDIYNPFVGPGQASDSWANDGGLNDFQALKPYIDEVNKYIAITAEANSVPCAKVSLAFNGPAGTDDPALKGYLTIDGVHPSDLGHKVIADSFRALSYAPLGAGQTTQSPPTIVTDAETRGARIVALDSVTFVRDPLPVTTQQNFSPDQRTRIMIFAENVDWGTDDPLSVVSAQAEDAQHKVYPLTAEFVGKIPGAMRFTQINLKLPDELTGGGDLQISISVRGSASNKALLTIRP